jgi:hypothetical protein
MAMGEDPVPGDHQRGEVAEGAAQEDDHVPVHGEGATQEDAHVPVHGEGAAQEDDEQVLLFVLVTMPMMNM